MGKNKKKNKKKHSTNPTGNQNEASASASSADIQATGPSSQNVTEAAAVQIFQIPVDNDIKEVADAFVEWWLEAIRYQKMTGLQGGELSETSQQNILRITVLNLTLKKLLTDKDPEYVGRVEKYISLRTAFRINNIFKSNEIKTRLIAEISDAIKKSLELGDSNEVERAISEEPSGPNLMSLDLQGDERKETGGFDKSVDILKETRDSSLNKEKKAEYVPLATHSNKTEKIHNIQNDYGTFESSEPDSERDMKSLESELRGYENIRRSVELALKTFKEEQASASSEKETDAAISKDKLDDATKESKEAADKLNHIIQKLKQFLVEKNLKSTDKIQPVKRSAESVLKNSAHQKYKSGDFQAALQSPKNVTEGNKGAIPKIFKSKRDRKSRETDDWENYATKVSKSVADQANDLIQELQIAETEVKKDDDKFTDEVQGATGFSESAAGFTAEEDSLIDRALNVVSETMTYKRLFEKGKKKTKSDERFRRDLKTFIRLQQTKLEKKIKESSHLDNKSKLKFLKDLRSIFSEKDSETSTMETNTTTELEGPATEDEKDRTKEFDKLKHIRFNYQTDGYRHINDGDQEFICSREDDMGNEFTLMNYKVKICFSDDHIQVATEKCEFDILIRKLHPAVSIDDAAQTDAAQPDALP